jgi:hypothetical protein
LPTGSFGAVVIDETWVRTNMAPIRGWCQPGKRLVGKVHGHCVTDNLGSHKGKAINAAIVATRSPLAQVRAELIGKL